MKAQPHQFTVIIEKDSEWFISYCPEVPGANGQGKTIEESKESLIEAIALIFEDRRKDAFRGLPRSAIKETIQMA